MSVFYFHIGLPKTGTTYLQKILDRDERVNFSRSQIHKFNKNDDLKLVQDKINVDSNETYLMRGEGAKKYNMMLTLSKIKNKFEHAELIITLRKPETALQSMFKYRIKNGAYFKSFDDWFINDEAQDFFSILHYGTLHKSLTAFFEEKDIHYLFYEDLESGILINEFYDIINLPNLNENLTLKVNKSLTHQELHKVNRINKYFSNSTLRKIVVKNLPFVNFKFPVDFFESQFIFEIRNSLEEEMNLFYQLCDEKTKNKLKAHQYFKI